MDNEIKHSPELSNEELEEVSGGNYVIQRKKKIVNRYHSCDHFVCKVCYRHYPALEGDNLNQRHQCPKGINYYMGCCFCLYYSEPDKKEAECNCTQSLVLDDMPGRPWD